MEKNYTIEEILIAVNDLQNSKKDKKLKSNPVETDKQNSADDSFTSFGSKISKISIETE